jgi:beta-lactamase superfamily II metal-dependent hydrolase
MYNVGFGDCFLLTLPTTDGQGARRILVDCGTHPSSTGKWTATKTVPLILEDLEHEAGRLRLDVVVMSHRHRDHVSGFTSERWSEVEVGEVWMPWTENPADPVATALRNKMGIAAEALSAAAVAFEKPSPAVEAATELLANNLALKNESAMETLWNGFRGKPVRQYLSAQAEPLETPLLPGVKIHVLGPSTEEAVIRDLEPPSEETFAHAASPKTTAPPPMPFDAEWAVPADRAGRSGAYAGVRVPGQIVGAIRALAADELLAAAASFTSSINGTSLMLVFEIGGLLLFFPGDAQWGTWKRVLDDPDLRSLLRRCTFYKIGHHGSHNATPRSFVTDVMAPSTTAAISVAPVKIWPFIPQTDLVQNIRDAGVTVLESNVPPAADAMPDVIVRDDRSIDFVFPVGGG